MVQVWAVNEWDWWAGEGTPEEILAQYMDATGCTRGESLDDENALPEPLDPVQMDEHKFRTEDDETISFTERMNRLLADPDTKFPCMFATTEF